MSESLKERIARAYLQKIDQLARAANEREGTPYGKAAVDLDALAELWDTPNPEVDEAQVWDEELTRAAQALADDPSLDRDEVLAEVPIIVSARVYPNREQVIRDMGGDSYEEWTRNAELVEEHAAKKRKPKPTPATPAPPPLPSAAEAAASEPVDVPASVGAEALLQPVGPALTPGLPAPPPPPPPAPAGLPAPGVTSAVPASPMMAPTGVPLGVPPLRPGGGI